MLCFCFFRFFFFFSSRRRHTRSKRDWSSDVCSSDLAGIAFLAVWTNATECEADSVAGVHFGRLPDPLVEALQASVQRIGPVVDGRSEERRVGKECRSRLAA